MNVLTIVLETPQVYTKEGVAIDVVGVAQVSPDQSLLSLARLVKSSPINLSL